ncbi:hypothetical protein [Winogradskyella sp.]|uniref:hypothetical protein n=1 Tax=Winogradskyella sp. TaxID=1883156 RepID=UPI002623A302|nr:hypothetical protein [Winogradskyella sp.]
MKIRFNDKSSSLKFQYILRGISGKWKLIPDGEERLDFSKFYNNKIYAFKKSDFDLGAEVIEEKRRLSVGLLTLPFKARPQDNFTFDQNST